MSRYLLAPLESRIQDQTVFSVLTTHISPVFGTPETIIHGYITFIDGAWFAGREAGVATQIPELGYAHPDLAARSVIS